MQQTGLVTGASSGIGKELARLHAERGRDLVIVARREDALHQLKEELEAAHGVTVRVLASDLTAADACQSLFDTLSHEQITIDYLFNNAGFGGRGLFSEQDWGMLEDMITLNITAVTQLSHLFLPGMISRGKGWVLNTSSIVGFMPGPLQAVYFATKAYVNSFSQALAAELDATGVTVTALCPGAVKTEFADVAGFAEDNAMIARGKSARYTAERGYAAMEAGQLEVITETGLKVAIKAGIPFVPQRQLMKIVKKLQA